MTYHIKIQLAEEQMALDSADFDSMLLAMVWQVVAAAKQKRKDLGYPTSEAKRLVEIE